MYWCTLVCWCYERNLNSFRFSKKLWKIMNILDKCNLLENMNWSFITSHVCYMLVPLCQIFHGNVLIHKVSSSHELIQYDIWSFDLHQIFCGNVHIHKVSSPHELIQYDFVFFFKCFMTMFIFIRFFLIMNLFNMTFEVFLFIKYFMAMFTFKRFLPLMNWCNMTFEVLFFIKRSWCKETV